MAEQTHSQQPPGKSPMDVAHTRVQMHLRAALEAIDAEMGAGQARQHPELVAAFIQACALDLAAREISRALHANNGRVPVVGTVS